MKIKELLVGFVTVFAVTLVAAIIVTYLYSLIAHGDGVIDWEMSFRLAIILGIALPLSWVLRAKKN